MTIITRRKALAVIPAIGAAAALPAIATVKDPHPEWYREHRAVEDAYNAQADLADELMKLARAQVPEFVPKPFTVDLGTPPGVEEHWKKSPIPQDITHSAEGIEYTRQMWLIVARKTPEREKLIQSVNEHFRAIAREFSEKEAAQAKERAKHHARFREAQGRVGYLAADAELSRVGERLSELFHLIMDTPAYTVAGIAAQVSLYALVMDNDVVNADLAGIASRLTEIAGDAS